MTHSEVVAGLEEAKLDAHLDRRHEDLADDGGRREAELAEWQRIVQLLAASGGPYDPDADAVVQEELTADRRRKEAEQQRLQEQQIAVRADELARLAKAGRLDRSVASLPGDEAACDLLAERGDYRAAAVDGWLAQALADHSGHYADPDARTAAIDGSLPLPVRAHAALLAALARTGAAAANSELDFVGRLAKAHPDATNALAAWLDSALSPALAAGQKGGTA
ncbi:hypothetical protein [Streptomyces sp. NRRL S-337]|uniref:hypothetical protein n=1 Tax=Streptomyces sp. NRRL S-337 TaxID=1463900 RepID=UPI001F1BA064|nr:hypothetical protein [Streptomyces sp. NRRL S-337]